MLKNVALAASIAAIGFSLPAAAHHSYAAFDQSKVVEVTGKVKRFVWRNPHIEITILTEDAKTGKMVEFPVEGTSVNQLMRIGWKGNMLKAGDTVSVKVNPRRSGSPGGSLLSMTLNGKTYDGNPRD